MKPIDPNTTLQPCPVCTGRSICFNFRGKKEARLVCVVCDTQTIWKPTMVEAIQVWNDFTTETAEGPTP